MCYQRNQNHTNSKRSGKTRQPFKEIELWRFKLNVEVCKASITLSLGLWQLKTQGAGQGIRGFNLSLTFSQEFSNRCPRAWSRALQCQTSYNFQLRVWQWKWVWATPRVDEVEWDQDTWNLRQSIMSSADHKSLVKLEGDHLANILLCV